MNEAPQNWYNTVLKIKEMFDVRMNERGFSSPDGLIYKQLEETRSRYNELEFVGLNGNDSEFDEIVSTVIRRLTESLPDFIKELLPHPFFSLYINLMYLEKALKIIKNEYELNFPKTLRHMEDLVYNSKDFKNLNEVSRNIGRKITNKELHADFGIIKKHINEQLEYIGNEQKFSVKHDEVDNWIEWLCRNPELADKYFPDLTSRLKERIRQSPPHVTALMIQKIPGHYIHWKKEVDNLIGKTKQKKIEEIISLLKGVLSEYEFPTEVESEAVNSVRDELSEQLLKWENELNGIDSSKDRRLSKNLKIDQIALMHVYSSEQITRTNANDIAKKYSHNSGEKLFQRFSYFSNSLNRRGRPNPCTQKKLTNKINLIESVINLLPKENRELAEKDLSHLTSILEKEYN